MAGDQIRLRLTHVGRSFSRVNGSIVKAVDDVSLEAREGDFLVLLGPSGCGKTTLLRCVAGLETPDEGKIEIDGAVVFDAHEGVHVPPDKRPVGMVFQSYALWPHMTVAQNVSYPLRMQRLAKAEIESRVARILAQMRIAELAEQYPGQISGGQQQRVALARALVRGDKVILFDEPLSNVDAKVREHLRLELLSMQRMLRFTAVYVTHDQDEAMSLATSIAVMAQGGVAQLGSPQHVYRRPASSYVARFVGSANRLDGSLIRDGDVWRVRTALGELVAPGDVVRAAAGDVCVISRPERWSIGEAQSGRALERRGRVSASAFVGSRNEYLVNVDGVELTIWSLGDALFPPGTDVWCGIAPRDLIILPKE